MPFYEYECPSCRYYAEVMQKISDAPLKKCPSCGKAGFKRLISAPVFRLKGSGWYETDFKSDKEGKRNLAGPDREDSKPSDDSGKSASPAKAADKPAVGKAAADKPASTSAKAGDSARPRRAAAGKTASRAPATRARASSARKPSSAGRKHK